MDLDPGETYLVLIEQANCANHNPLDGFECTTGNGGPEGVLVTPLPGEEIVINFGFKADLLFNLIPDRDPTIIPPEGGNVGFTAEFANYSGNVASFDVWTSVTLPWGPELGPLQGPAHLTVPHGFFYSIHLEQRMPPNAPIGTYSHNGFLGQYPFASGDSDSFDIIKPWLPDGSNP